MARGDKGLGNRIAPPRFIAFLGLLACGLIVYRLTGDDGLADALATAFDLAALVFLISLVPLVRRSDASSMRRHSAANDANRALVLVVTTVVTMAVLAVIFGELPRAASGDRIAMVRLMGTLALAWLFANSVYALHYAHLYYTRRADAGGDMGGIEFPGKGDPDYLDFAYFSFTLGMTFQTSDTEITGRTIRRIATVHSLAAFVFNIGIIAFAINAIGGS